MTKKKVYIAMAADVIHNGHINVIKEGMKHGEITIGLLTDEVIATYKRLPILDYKMRKSVFENLKGVTSIIKQDTLSYKKNLLKLKPDYVIHGDDWKVGAQSKLRTEVIELLSAWGGKLIEVPYTKGMSCTKVEEELKKFERAPDFRRKKLKKLLSLKPYIRVIEASNGLTGIIAENAKYQDEETGIIKSYDAMWVSSLCDSTFKGKPDIELVDLTSRINTINEIMEVTTKPIILDGDTGGKIEHFVFNVKTLERIGVSAIIIEDKTGLKQNSLYGTSAKQVLDDPHNFATKIRMGKEAQSTKDFMIFARIESLIAGQGVDDAISRAKIYIEEGGADGIMIHSKDKEGTEIIEFMKEFRKYSKTIPVIFVPTTYNHLTEEELNKIGGNIIIHANHLLRSAYPAMKNCAETILKYGRSKEADSLCLPIKEVLSLIPGGKKND